MSDNTIVALFLAGIVLLLIICRVWANGLTRAKETNKPHQAVYMCDVCGKHTGEFQFYAKLTAIWDSRCPGYEQKFISRCCSAECVKKQRDILIQNVRRRNTLRGH